MTIDDLTKDDLLEVVATLTCKNMALEEKIKKMEESHEFQLQCVHQKLDLYIRLYENKCEEVEEFRYKAFYGDKKDI